MKASIMFFAATLSWILPYQGVTKCYECFYYNFKCNIESLKEISGVPEKKCGSSSEDFACISVTKGNITLKGCVINDSISDQECKEMNQEPNSSCYMCNTDLCNRKRYPKQCYSCLGDCQPPYQIEDCPASNTVEYVCRQSKITINNVVYERRGCAADTEDVNNVCNNLEKSDIGSCLMCPDDLCNNFLYPKVTQCYTCEGYCNSLSVEKCPNYGSNYICMTFKSVTGNTTVERRGCYLDYADIRHACRKSNEFNNESCYTCERDLCNVL